MAGFREEDDADISDLLAPSTGFGTSSTYSAFGGPAGADDDDLDTNPFADMASSTIKAPYSPPVTRSTGQTSFYSEAPAVPPEEEQEPFYQPPDLSSSSAYDESAYQPQSSFADEPQSPFQSEEALPPPIPTVYSGEPSTPSAASGQAFASPPGRSFAREGAPEPETPAGAQLQQYQQQPYQQQQQQQQYQQPPSPPPQPQHAPGDPDAFTYNPYASSTLHRSLLASSPPTSPTAPSPFPASPRGKPRPNLSTLLGGDDDKPKTPSFRREGGGGKGMSKSAILPGGRAGTSTFGRKMVGGGALAALLGEGVEEDDQEEKKEVVAKKEDKKPEKEKDGEKPESIKEVKPVIASSTTEVAEEGTKEKEGRVEPEAAPLPPDTLSTSVEPSAASATEVAVETPLPPSRSATPTPTAPASTTAPNVEEPKPSLSRTFSSAASSVSTESAGINAPYESMVSPLETGETPRDGEGGNAAWPANKAIATAEPSGSGIDEQLAGLKIDTGSTPSPATSTSTLAGPTVAAASSPSSSTSASQPQPLKDDVAPAASVYQQYIFRDDNGSAAEAAGALPSSAADEGSGFSSAASTVSSASRGFRAFNASEGDEGGFGGFRADDADSLRGAYSRSVEVEAGEGEGEEAETVGTPGTVMPPQEGQAQRTEREGSAPLPPLPPQVPSIQGSPRSTELGGSLGPTFIISVGDPQTVGSALNPTSQHTVYTVRIRTTSSAFRKSDFSVLRRYSHFVWLYEALVQNNPGVIVPGMPEKHAIGRFGSEFVENRRLGLQASLNKIVSHPMLVGDPDLRLFLESDTFHVDIKQRKIDTSSENKGFLANLSSSISGPKFVEHDEYFEQRKHQLDVFETQLRSLLHSLHTAAKARATLHASIAELQSAFLALGQCDLSSTLRRLFDQAAAVQKRIYDLAEAQMAHEEQIGGLVNVAESYARLCASAKGVFGARIKAYHHWQAAESNFRKLASQHDKAKKAGRTHSELLNLSVAEIADDGSLRITFGNQAERKMLDAKHDFDDVSKLTKAEMARVDKEKVDDFKKALEEYADSMAARQRHVVEAWQQYHDLLAKAAEVQANPPPPSETTVPASTSTRVGLNLCQGATSTSSVAISIQVFLEGYLHLDSLRMGKKRTADDEWQPVKGVKRERSPTGASATGGTRKPGRTSVACTQCRSRKSNCSLTGPACEGCVSRGEAESCSFQSFIWIDNVDDLPSRQLKRKVDRLEELLKSLASPPPSSAGLPSPALTAGRPTPVETVPTAPVFPDFEGSPPSKHSRAASAPCILDAPALLAATRILDSQAGPFRPQPVDRLRAQACIALTRAVLSGDDVPPLGVPGLDSRHLSDQLRGIEQQYAGSLPVFDYPVPAALHAYVGPEEYDRCVRAILPSPQQARVALSAFFSFVNPFLKLFHPSTFLSQCEEFWRSGDVPEPAFVASYLLACGGGLAAAPDGDATYGLLPSGEAKEMLARTWLDGGRRVLAATGFMLKPTVEGIRALHLLLQWWSGEGGRYMEQALSITSCIIGLAFDLQLNRDPDEVAPHLGPVEADLRRRLWYATWCFEAMSRPLLGHPWTPFDEEDVSTRYPSDEDIGTSDIPSPLYSAATLNFRINKLLGRVKAPQQQDVAKLLSEMEALDEPEQQNVLQSAMIRWGYIRLQRFAAKVGLTTEEQDATSSRYFAELLDSVDAMATAGGGTSTIVLCKIFSVAIAAAIDLAGVSFAISSMDPMAAQLARLVQNLRACSLPRTLSRLVARGLTVLEHLLPALADFQFAAPSLHLESVPSEYSSVMSSRLATPSTASSVQENFSTFPAQQRYAFEAQQDQPPPPFMPMVTAGGFAYLQSVPTTTAGNISAPGPPPPAPASSVEAQQPYNFALRTTRPNLSLFTSMAPPAVPTKMPTPIAISPWVDAAITPSRYIGSAPWERFM
ncbi:hypothetical protein JCM11251_002991 [Rhodosporidiobolus azoricus]